MKMIEVEKELLDLCPGWTFMLNYERSHIGYLTSPAGKSFGSIRCSIWVSELREHYKGRTWDLAMMKLREGLKINPPQPCPDQETEVLALPESEEVAA